MIVLRGTPEQLARIEQRRHRGLLAWLYGDGVLLIPADLQPPGEDGDDPLLRELERALTEPIDQHLLSPAQHFPLELAPYEPPRWRWRRPRWLSRRG